MKNSIKYLIVYINLDHALHRRKFMEKEFKNARVNEFLRFSAIDAEKEGALDQSRFVHGTGDRWELHKNAIACFESHRAVWQMAVDQGLDAVVIFEDDVLVSADISKIISKFVKLSNQFDVIKLDIGGQKTKCAKLIKIAGLPVRKLIERINSAGGYILSNSGAKKLIQRSKTYGDTLDDFLFSPLNDWRMYQLFPATATQGVYVENFNNKLKHPINYEITNSEREKSPKNNHKNLSKGPMWFRIRKELKRIQNKLLWNIKGKKKLLRQGGYHGLTPISRNLMNRLKKNE